MSNVMKVSFEEGEIKTPDKAIVPKPNFSLRKTQPKTIRKNIKTVSVFLPVILLDLATLITNFLILLSRILYSGLNVLIITQFTIGIWNNMNG